MKATMKLLNGHLKAQLPQYDFVKGSGYFYFGYDATMEELREPPESLMIWALHQMTLEQWKVAIDGCIERWRLENTD